MHRWRCPVDPARRPLTQNLRHALEPPSAAFWFGADEPGRNILTRIVYGARASPARPS